MLVCNAPLSAPTGIQHMFYEDSDVLYMSLHRHDFGGFFPMSDDGDHDRVGAGAGAGYNVNVPWNRARMGAAEYITAMLAVVLPVAYQFCPELVLVSAGFDAARGDPLGGYQVPPEVYGHLTHHLMALAGGRVILALEGGYNLTSISYSMAMCARALLGDPPVLLPPLPPVNESAARSLCSVAHSQRPFWPAVAEPYRLPREPLETVRRAVQKRREAAKAEEGVTISAAATKASGDAAATERTEEPPSTPRAAWQSEAETKPEPESPASPLSEAEPEPVTQATPQPESESKPVAQPEPEPDTQSIETQPKTQAKSEAQPKSEPESLERLVDRLTLAEGEATQSAGGDSAAKDAPSASDATACAGAKDAPPAAAAVAWAEPGAAAAAEEGAAAGDAGLQEFLHLEEVADQVR